MVNINRTPKDVDIYAGERLRYRRLEQGMSQKSLAQQVGVTFQQIQKYEKGLNRIGASRLHDFCKILRVKPSYFFQDIHYVNKDSSQIYSFAESEEPSEELIEIIKHYKEIKDASRKKIVLDLIKALSQK